MEIIPSSAEWESRQRVTGPEVQKPNQPFGCHMGKPHLRTRLGRKPRNREKAQFERVVLIPPANSKAVLVNVPVPRMGTQLASGWEGWEGNRKRVFIAKISGFFCCGISGIIPWNAVPGKACGPILENICNTNEVQKHNLCAAFASETLGHGVINNLVKVFGENQY